MTELTAAVTLPEFLGANEVGRLSPDDRQLIVQQALTIFRRRPHIR
jgi:hypothetical protein